MAWVKFALLAAEVGLDSNKVPMQRQLQRMLSAFDRPETQELRESEIVSGENDPVLFITSPQRNISMLN